CTEGASASNPVSGSVIAEVEVDVVRVDAGPGGGPLGGAHGDLVVAARVEVLELVHPVQHVDELAQEDPGREPHLGAELPGHGAGEVGDVRVGDLLRQARCVLTAAQVQVAHADPHLGEGVLGEAGQANLHGPRVVEPRVGHEG